MDLTAEQRIAQTQAQATSEVGDAQSLARGEQIANVSRFGSLGAGAAVAARGGWVGLAAFGAAVGGGYAGAWLAEATGADELAADAMQAFGMTPIGAGGPHPARVTDQVAHSHAFGGFLAGIVVGALAAVAVGALIVATGGAAAVVLIGAAAAGGLAGGFVGTALGKAAASMGTRTGPITSGSPDVFIEGLAAARMTDVAACSKESTPQPIIEGSETIFVNGLPLARIGHKLLCGAVIDQGASTVFMDETTVACAQPAPEIPVWARVAADWLGFLPVGKAAAMLGNRSRSAAATGRSQCNVRCAADPVDVATGWFVDWRCDITIPGPLPIEWRRHYASGRKQSGANSFHGGPWLDSWSVRLTRANSDRSTIDYHDDEGVVYTFHTPDDELDAEHLRAPNLVLRGTRTQPELWDRDSGIRAHFVWRGDQARLAAYSDTSGNRCEFVYTATAREPVLSELRHSDGWRLDLHWQLDADHEPTTIQSVWLDDPGRPIVELVRFEHDAHGRLTHSASLDSGRLRYAYDAQDRIVAWGDDSATQVHIRYNPQGRVSEVITPGHLHSGQFEYDTDARMTRVYSLTDEASGDDARCDEYHYNADGLVTRVRNALGHETHTQWDRHHRMLSTTDALGRTTLYEYDDDGRLVVIVDPQDRKREFNYDEAGRLLSATDVHGRTVTLAYDDSGRLAGRTQAGQTTRFEHTADGHPLREHHPDGGISQYHYDEDHGPCGATAPNGAHTAWRQDRLGRLNWITDAVGATTTYDHELGGYPAAPATQAPRANVHTQPQRIVLPDGSAISQRFNTEGLLAERTDAAGHTQRWRWGAFDLLAEHVDAAGKTTHYRYSGVGGEAQAPRLTELTNAAGQSWRWHYDAAGNLVEQTDAAGRPTRWQHDAAGRPLVRQQPDGSTWRYEWDAADRLLGIEAADVRHAYRYDERDRLVQASVWRRKGESEHCDSDLKLEYDDNDRLLAETHRLDERAEPRRISYQYDELGRRIGRDGPLGQTQYHYDALGLLSELHTAHGTVRIGRDALGREVERVSGVSPSPSHPQFRLQQQYDKLGQLVLQRAPSSAAHRTDTVQRSYHWQHQRLVGLDDARFGQTRWQLDAREQIVQARLDPSQQQHPTASTALGRHPHEVQATTLHERFGYDAIGNLAAVGEEPLRYQRDVVTERGPDRYEWDALGRLTRRTVLRNGFRPQTWEYGWDSLNRLIHVYTPSGQYWRYIYDALGRRRAKVCETASPAQPHQRPRLRSAEYLWDGAAVAAQWKVYADGTSAAPAISPAARLHEYVQEWHYEADSFNPLAVVQQRSDDRQAKLYHVVSDLNGAPRELIGNDGELVWAGQLDTWGQLRRCDVQDCDRVHAAQFAPGYRAAANDALIDVDLRFANQWADEESGLSYNLNRYYDPDLGSYISQDPLGPRGGIRTHGYVHNPLTWIDPLGLTGCPAKRGPKTDPTAPHNAKIRTEGDRLALEGNDILAGGGRAPERAIPTPGGYKGSRRPDILYKTPDGTVKGLNVGKTKVDGAPVSREAKAIQDLNAVGVETDFVPYDR